MPGLGPRGRDPTLRARRRPGLGALGGTGVAAVATRGLGALGGDRAKLCSTATRGLCALGRDRACGRSDPGAVQRSAGTGPSCAPPWVTPGLCALGGDRPSGTCQRALPPRPLRPPWLPFTMTSSSCSLHCSPFPRHPPPPAAATCGLAAAGRHARTAPPTGRTPGPGGSPGPSVLAVPQRQTLRRAPAAPDLQPLGPQPRALGWDRSAEPGGALSLARERPARGQ